MATFIKKIQYKHPNIGYFPDLDKYLAHGFSWGKAQGNMQFSLGNPIDVRLNVVKFLDALNMGNIRDTVNMISEHSDQIVSIDKVKYNSLKPHRFGRSIKCDALFTNLQNVTLTAKPGDCTTAIVHCKRQDREDVIGIIHSGRRGVEVALTKKSIKYLEEDYGCDVSDIKIGIVPHLFKENRQFENIDDFDENVWKGFIDKRNGYYYPGETELAIKQYLDSGIRKDNFFVYDIDTYKAASREESFSYKYHLEMTKNGKVAPEGRFIVAVKKK